MGINSHQQHARGCSGSKRRHIISKGFWFLWSRWWRVFRTSFESRLNFACSVVLPQQHDSQRNQLNSRSIGDWEAHSSRQREQDARGV